MINCEMLCWGCVILDFVAIFFFFFEGFGWLVWLFKIAEQVFHFNYFFLMNTTKKKKKTDDLIWSKLHNTLECGVVLNSEHISHLICTTTT